MKSVTLKVEGMSCEGCANAVKSALMQVAGVQSADISLAAKQATVEVEDDVPAADLVGPVEAAGYRATVSR